MKLRFLMISITLFLGTTTSFASSWDSFKKQDYDASFRSAYLAEKAENNATGLDYFVLGRIYLEGLGASDEDQPKALYYFKKAISSGSVEAAMFLAETYEQGQKTEKSVVDALKFYKIAAGMGQPDLENKIAILATQISGGEVSASSCPEILDAAGKGEEDFYILAAKCHGIANAEVSTYQPMLLKAFERSSYKDGSIVIDLLLNKKSQLYSPSFAIKIVAEIPDEHGDFRDKFFETVFVELQKHVTEDEFKASLSTLHNAYTKDAALQPQLIRLLILSLESRSRAIPEMAVNYLVEELSSSFDRQARLQVIKELFSADTLSSENKKRIIEITAADASKFFAKHSGNPKEKNKFAKQMMDQGFCIPAKMIFEGENFEIASSYAMSIAELEDGCLDGDFESIVKAFADFPDITENSALMALKDLCASSNKNGCHALGLVYSKNTKGLYGKDEAEQFSLAAFEKGVAAGSADSAMQLALYYGKKGRKEQAVQMAKTAYANGLIEGLYAESSIRLKGIFSASSKSCAPLLRFLVEAKINNPYFEDARALRKRKKCK